MVDVSESVSLRRRPCTGRSRAGRDARCAFLALSSSQLVRVLLCSLSGPASALVRTLDHCALKQELNVFYAAASRAACLNVPAHSVASSSRVFQLQGVQRRKYVCLF